MKPLPDPLAEGGPFDALIFEKTHINSSTWSALTPQNRSSRGTLRKIST